MSFDVKSRSSFVDLWGLAPLTIGGKAIVVTMTRPTKAFAFEVNHTGEVIKK